jgi:hypothetical protein
LSFGEHGSFRGDNALFRIGTRQGINAARAGNG